MGGQWIGPTQHRAVSLVAELGLDLYGTYDEGKHTVEFNGKLNRYSGRIPWLGALTLADIGLAQLKLDAAARRVNTDAPWATKNASRLDRETFAQWMARNVKTTGGDKFFRIVHRSGVLGRAGGYVGAVDDVLSRLRGWARCADHHTQGSPAGSGRRRQPVDLSAARGTPRQLRARSNVIVGRDRLVRGPRTVTTADGRIFAARRVVLAVPPALAGRIATTPPMPLVRNALVEGMPMGSVISAFSRVVGPLATSPRHPAPHQPPLWIQRVAAPVRVTCRRRRPAHAADLRKAHSGR